MQAKQSINNKAINRLKLSTMKKIVDAYKQYVYNILYKKQTIVTDKQKAGKMGFLTLNNIVLFVLIFAGWFAYRKHDEKLERGAYRYPNRKPDALSTAFAYALFVITSCISVIISCTIIQQLDPENAIVPLFASAIITLAVIIGAFIGTAKIGKIIPAGKEKEQGKLVNGKSHKAFEDGETQKIQKY